jgi:hypothetical protein
MQGAVGLLLHALVLSAVFDFADEPLGMRVDDLHSASSAADTAPLIAIGAIRQCGHTRPGSLPICVI